VSGNTARARTTLTRMRLDPGNLGSERLPGRVACGTSQGKELWKMRKLIIALSLLIIFASPPLAMAAGGNTWSTLSQQWNRIQNSQKKQSEHFRVLEREAARSANDLNHGSGINKAKLIPAHNSFVDDRI
jgi:hypothetical protein